MGGTRASAVHDWPRCWELSTFDGCESGGQLLLKAWSWWHVALVAVRPGTFPAAAARDEGVFRDFHQAPPQHALVREVLECLWVRRSSGETQVRSPYGSETGLPPFLLSGLGTVSAAAGLPDIALPF